MKEKEAVVVKMYDIKFFFWTPSAGGRVESVGAAVPAVHGPGGGEEEGAVGEMTFQLLPLFIMIYRK